MSARLSMSMSPRPLLLIGCIVALVFVAARPAGSAGIAGTRSPLPFAAANLDAEKREGEKIASKFTAYLGPLAPVALSPFFALTCLSGASLLADSGLPLTGGIKNNPILGENSALNNPLVFAGLLVLTIITAAPKLTKVTKPLAQAVDQIEAHAGIIAIVAVQFLSQVNLDGDAPPGAAIVFQAGIFSFTYDVILAIASAINIFVVNTVKFFCEVMTWLSPFPTVDALFEAANKSFAAFLVGVYVWSPWVATILNLLIFAICLLVFAWVRRRAVYMRGVLADPILGWIKEAIFRRPPMTVSSTHVPSSVARQFPQRTLVLKAFVGQGIADLKRKTRGYLIQAEGRLSFVQPRMFRTPIATPLPEPAGHTTVERGLLSNSVNFPAANGGGVATVIVTRRYNAVLEEVCALLRAASQTGACATAAPSERALASSREIGTAAKAAAGRAELRAELA